MPLVTLTIRANHSEAFKTQVLGAVHHGLVSSGVPANDMFQRVLELSEENFRFDATYPDLSSPRTANFVLIEILLSVGRSVKIKRKIIADIHADLAASEAFKQIGSAENVMIVFKETSWENWSFGGGRMVHA